jgi:peptidoglycan/LPS O-acetylase OafA/YrhL
MERMGRLGHRPALDGLRGVAVLLVVLAHAHVPGMEAAGGVGVCLFFVLSGYLITGLLLAEHDASGRVRFRAFYARRARRLLPALGSLLAFLLALRALTGMADIADTRSVVGAVFYVNNWQVGHHNLTTLLHTWSLSVEEQFYSVWPMVLLLCLRRGGRALASRVALTAIGFLLCIVGVYVAAGASLYSYTTFTGFAAVLGGSLLALRPLRLPSWCGWVAVVLIAVGSFMPPAIGVLAQFAGVVAGVLAVSSGGAIGQALSGGVVGYFGRRSYAIYLWHYPLLLMARSAPEESRWLVRVLLIAATFLIAEVSWRFLEQPILRGGALRHRAPHFKVTDHEVVGAVGVGTRLVDPDVAVGR